MSRAIDLPPLRIVVVSSGLRPEYGGAAISEASLCTALTPHGEVRVLCPKERWAPEFTSHLGLGGVRPFSPVEVLTAMVNGRHWLHGVLDGADILHLNGHWRWENYLFTRLCRAKGIPYLLHPRGMFVVAHRNVVLKRFFNLLFGKQIVRHAAKIIALSRHEISQFEPYPISPERIAVVPNGIPIPDGSRTGTAVPEDTTYFLYIGRLERRKNLLFLVDAYDLYLRTGGKARLLMMGPAERGYDDEILAKIRALRITDNVSLIPPVYDGGKWQYIRDARAVIYPTTYEPYGRVPFEAVAAGTFPIVSDDSGSAEYLSPFLPYCIYQHSSHSSLVETMKAIERRTDRDDLTRARAWMADALDWKSIADTVVRIYGEARAVSPSDQSVTNV
jgi:glycosyltransferase involved in cell wall biosynthesis